MFPLTKTESVEHMINYMASSKTKLVGGSLRSVSSPRARSAHTMGPRSRSIYNMKPRVESSQAPQNRDLSVKIKTITSQ